MAQERNAACEGFAPSRALEKAAAVVARNATVHNEATIQAIFDAAPVGAAGEEERRAAAQLLLMLEADAAQSDGETNNHASNRSTTRPAPQFPSSDEELALALAAHHRRAARDNARLRDMYADRVVTAAAVALGIAQLGAATAPTTVPATARPNHSSGTKTKASAAATRRGGQAKPAARKR